MKQQFLMVTTNTMIITAITNEATVANGYNKCNNDNGKMKYSVYIYDIIARFVTSDVHAKE